MITKLAQAGSDIGLVSDPSAATDLGLGTYSSAQVAGNLITPILLVVVGIVLTIFWIMALYGSATRNDMKHPRWMWVLIVLFVPFGFYFYFFIENRKKLGYASLILTGLLILVPILGFLF